MPPTGLNSLSESVDQGVGSLWLVIRHHVSCVAYKHLHEVRGLLDVTGNSPTNLWTKHFKVPSLAIMDHLHGILTKL